MSFLQAKAVQPLSLTLCTTTYQWPVTELSSKSFPLHSQVHGNFRGWSWDPTACCFVPQSKHISSFGKTTSTQRGKRLDQAASCFFGMEGKAEDGFEAKEEQCPAYTWPTLEFLSWMAVGSSCLLVQLSVGLSTGRILEMSRWCAQLCTRMEQALSQLNARIGYYDQSITIVTSRWLCNRMLRFILHSTVPLMASP